MNVISFLNLDTYNKNMIVIYWSNLVQYQDEIIIILKFNEYMSNPKSNLKW